MTAPIHTTTIKVSSDIAEAQAGLEQVRAGAEAMGTAVKGANPATGQAATLHERFARALRQSGSGTVTLGTAAAKGAVSMRSFTVAGVQLAQGLASGNVSATSLTSTVTRLATRLGPVGIAIGVLSGGLLLVRRHAIQAREAAERLEKQLRQVRRGVDDLLRVDRKSPFQAELDNITDSIRELDRELAKQRQSLWQRLFGDITLKNMGSFLSSIGRFVGGGEKPLTREERDALAAQGGRLTPEAERETERGRFGQAVGLQNTLDRLFDVNRIDQLSTGLEATRQHLENLVVMGLDPFSQEAQDLAASIQQGEQALRDMRLAADTMRAGLEAIGNQITTLLVEGTANFEQFIQNLLRMMLDATASSFVDSIMRSVLKQGGGGGTATATVGEHQHGGIVPGLINQPRLAVVHGGEQILSVSQRRGGGRGDTFNIAPQFVLQAIDDVDAERFVERMGPALARQIARQVDRSSALRHRFRRG